MFKGNKKIVYPLIYAIIVLGIIMTFNYTKVQMTTQTIPYSQFKTMLADNQIESVVVEGNTIQVTPKPGTKEAGKILDVTKMNDPDLVSEMAKAGVTFEAQVPQTFPLAEFLLSWILPFAFLMIVGRFMFGRLDKKMGGGVMSFGKNNAKVYAEAETGVTFDDVAGQDEAKESLKEIVDFLHDTDRYVSIGAKLPKGALLVGPPGTGKTLLAKAVAGEAKVPFFSLAGSDFVEMFVGMGAARVRDLFKQAQEKAPCIVFIDEIDAIGKSREGSIQGNDEREQTLNQLLTEMDGFDSSKGVVILAATNRPEVLDKALLRPGRFDRRVIVDRPDLIGREAILKVHSKEVKMSKEVSLEAIAKATPGAVGADLANIINEGALRAVKRNRKLVIQEDLEEAVEIIIAGKEKKDRIMTSKEKRTVAYHEVGHALVAALLNNTDPVHKITIIPRTMGALGYTMQLPEEEKYLLTKEEMMEQIAVMFGGRAAEEVEFGRITTGASNDIERATQSARNMVTMYGMSDRFDMMALESASNRYLDGRNVMNCSNETATIVDEEVLKIIKASHKIAVDILHDNKELLDRISSVLLEKETIMGDEFMDIVYEKYPEKKEKMEALKREKEELKKAAKAKRYEMEAARKEKEKELIAATNEEAKAMEEELSYLTQSSDEIEKNEAILEGVEDEIATEHSKVLELQKKEEKLEDEFTKKEEKLQAVEEELKRVYPEEEHKPEAPKTENKDNSIDE